MPLIPFDTFVNSCICCSFFILSFNSRIILCADFAPIPGICVNVFISSDIIANANSVGSHTSSIVIAVFAPTPLTDISNSNILNSSNVLNPNILISSSLTL